MQNRFIFNFRPDNRIITFAPPSASISPFPVRFAQVNSTCLARNLIFYLRVALLVKPIYYRFVHTSSTHGPHIKSTSRAISQYIHYWDYFQPVKRYGRLKFSTMCVSQLWMILSNVFKMSQKFFCTNRTKTFENIDPLSHVKE